MLAHLCRDQLGGRIPEPLTGLPEAELGGRSIRLDPAEAVQRLVELVSERHRRGVRWDRCLDRRHQGRSCCGDAGRVDALDPGQVPSDPFGGLAQLGELALALFDRRPHLRPARLERFDLADAHLERRRRERVETGASGFHPVAQLAATVAHLAQRRPQLRERFV